MKLKTTDETGEYKNDSIQITHPAFAICDTRLRARSAGIYSSGSWGGDQYSDHDLRSRFPVYDISGLSGGSLPRACFNHFCNISGLDENLKWAMARRELV
jgi:hypothetical protein